MKYLLLLAVLISLFGCQSVRKEARHMQSTWVGLNRTVTVYRLDGTPLRTWSGQFMIESTGAGISFIDSAGKDIKVFGGIVIVEQR